MILLTWLILSICCGMYASKLKRSGFCWFLISLILSPLIAFILLVVMGESSEAKEKRVEVDNTVYDIKKEAFFVAYVQSEAAVKNIQSVTHTYEMLSNNKIVDVKVIDACLEVMKK